VGVGWSGLTPRPRCHNWDGSGPHAAAKAAQAAAAEATEAASAAPAA
jgi:hypothetical protein